MWVEIPVNTDTPTHKTTQLTLLWHTAYKSGLAYSSFHFLKALKPIHPNTILLIRYAHNKITKIFILSFNVI